MEKLNRIISLGELGIDSENDIYQFIKPQESKMKNLKKFIEQDIRLLFSDTHYYGFEQDSIIFTVENSNVYVNETFTQKIFATATIRNLDVNYHSVYKYLISKYLKVGVDNMDFDIKPSYYFSLKFLEAKPGFYNLVESV